MQPPRRPSASSRAPAPDAVDGAPLRTRLVLPFVVALVAQAALAWRPALPWVLVLRPLPLVALAAGVARAVPVSRAWPVALGLLLGGFGDAAMTLRHRAASDAPLLAGIAFFLLGHVAYAIAFFRDRAYRPSRAACAGAFVVVALVASAWMLPRLGPLAAPIAAYTVGLTAMAALAALRRSPRSTVFVGAALFFVSDALIGARLAAPDMPRAALALVLPTYYLGQWAIAYGWTRDALAAEPASAPLGP